MTTTTTTTPKVTTASKVAIPVKGSTTIAAIAEAMGAQADGHAYRFNLSVEIVGESIQAKSAAIVSNADKEAAMESLTPAERKAIEKFNSLCKASAAARVDGQSITKTTWNGIAKG